MFPNLSIIFWERQNDDILTHLEVRRRFCSKEKNVNYRELLVQVVLNLFTIYKTFNSHSFYFLPQTTYRSSRQRRPLGTRTFPSDETSLHLPLSPCCLLFYIEEGQKGKFSRTTIRYFFRFKGLDSSY